MNLFSGPREQSTAEEFGAARSALERAQQAADAAFGVLNRVIPIARRVASFVRMMMIAGIVATGVIVVSLLSIDVPRTPVPWLVILATAAVLVFPALVLRSFHRALEEVLALPAWLRSSPDIARRHATELAILVAQANGDAGTGGTATSAARRAHIRDAWKAGRLLLETKNDVPGYGSALRLISPFFLFMVLVAFAGVWTEILFAVFAVCFAVAAHLI